MSGPLVAVLAGGRGRRMGGAKALAELGGRPLIAWPLAAAAAAGLPAVVVAKRSTALPALGVPVWLEPDEPTHPLLGVVCALERHGGPVVVVGCDMPFVSGDLLARLARGPEAATDAGPLPARYEPGQLRALTQAVRAGASLRSTTPSPRLAVPGDVVTSVNTPADLTDAQISGS